MIHRRYELPVRRVARPRVFLPTQIVRTARELTSRALTVKAISSCLDQKSARVLYGNRARAAAESERDGANQKVSGQHSTRDVLGELVSKM
jgi:hypothetical protein